MKRLLLTGLTIALILTPGAAEALPLLGKTVVIDPGHNGANGSHPATINRPVDVGGGRKKACNTTGTATASGYSEAAFNWDVAVRLRRVLRRRGAHVVMTRENNRGVGPCIDERARIANRARALATVSIHGDGATAAGARGFHVIEPAKIRGLTDDIFSRSHRLALALRGAFRSGTGTPYSNYLGRNGIDRRSDLGGLRLANVPAVFIETGNMKNAKDARRMMSSRYRLRAARAIADGIERFAR